MSAALVLAATGTLVVVAVVGSPGGGGPTLRPQAEGRRVQERSPGISVPDESRRGARAPTAVGAPDGPAAVLGATLLSIARAERSLARGQEPARSRADLERAVERLAGIDRALARVLEALERAPQDGVAVEDARLWRYGAVRGFYWVALVRARAGEVEPVRAAMSSAFELVGTLERESASYLAENVATLLASCSAARSREQLDELVALRAEHRGRADLYDRLLLALASGLDPSARRALAWWLVADPSDADAVARGLEELFALDDPWIALGVARESFATADAAGRRAIALAVARSAPVELAVDFALERVDALGNVPAAWLELGRRSGSAEELQLAYGDLRATGGDAESRRLAVMAMGTGAAEDLRWIAVDDPDPGVRSQAVLTLTANGHVDAAADVDAVLDVVGRAHGDALTTSLWAASNALESWDARQRAELGPPLLDGLRAAVLDDARPAEERAAVLETIEGWLDPAERAWLRAEVDAAGGE